MEQWKDIRGFEGLYQISSSGIVKSIKGIKKRILVNAINSHGYFVVTLSKNGIRHTRGPHRLVAEAFIENSENKPFVNHKNGIKTDNRVSNLEWCTPKENIIHAFENNLSQGLKGIKNGGNKLSEAEVIQMRLKRKDMKLGELASQFGVCKQTVSQICKRQRWKHI